MGSIGTPGVMRKYRNTLYPGTCAENTLLLGSTLAAVTVEYSTLAKLKLAPDTAGGCTCAGLSATCSCATRGQTFRLVMSTVTGMFVDPVTIPEEVAQ